MISTRVDRNVPGAFCGLAVLQLEGIPAPMSLSTSTVAGTNAITIVIAGILCKAPWWPNLGLLVIKAARTSA